MAAATRDGPEQVHLDGGVERGVEGDGGGRVDDDVARGQQLPALVVEAQPSVAHVAGHRRHPGWPPRRRSRSPSSLAQPVEAVVADDLPGRPAAAASAPASGRTSSTTWQSGTARSSRSTRAVPRNPVAPVTKIRLPGQGVATIGSPESVYHMVSER